MARHFGLRNDYYHKNHTYSALSKCQANGSIRLTAAAAHGGGTLNGYNTNHNLRHSDTNDAHIQKQSTDLTILHREPSCTKCPGHSYDRDRCVSVCSQSTMLTTVSKNDLMTGPILRDGSLKSNSSPFIVSKKSPATIDEKTNHHNPLLSTIAEKLRRGTKKVFLFKPSSVPSSPNSAAAAIPSRELKKGNSVESAHTNTISNSSLQEVDDDEFDSAELAKHMGEINREIR